MWSRMPTAHVVAYNYEAIITPCFRMNEHFRRYSRGNVASTYLKIICIFATKYSLLAAMQRDVTKNTVTATGFTVEDQYLIKCS